MELEKVYLDQKKQKKVGILYYLMHFKKMVYFYIMQNSLNSQNYLIMSIEIKLELKHLLQIKQESILLLLVTCKRTFKSIAIKV